MPTPRSYIGRIIWNNEVIGTGFVVHESGLIATCYHVLKTAGESFAGKDFIFEPLYSAIAIPTIATSKFNKQQDVALLQALDPLPRLVTVATLIQSDAAEPNMPFYTQGFGKVADLKDRYRYLSASGLIIGPANKNDVDLLQLRSQEVLRGMSGGPVIVDLVDGVIGVVSGRYTVPRDDTWLEHTVWASRIEALVALDPHLLHTCQPVRSAIEIQPKQAGALSIKSVVSTYPQLSQYVVRRQNLNLFFALGCLALIAILIIALVLQNTTSLFTSRNDIRMTGDVRIAFPKLDPGPPQPDLDINKLSAYTDQLTENLKKSIGQGLGQESNLSFDVWGPKQLSPITIPMIGDAINTQLLAQQINANIVLQGSLGENDQEGVLSLQLNVIDAPFVEAGELLGSYYIGEPINYVAPLGSIASQAESSKLIQQRLEVVTALSLGIGQITSPRMNVQVDRAQNYFDRALTLIRESGVPKKVTTTNCPDGFNPPQRSLESTDPQAEATVLVLKGNAAARAGKYRDAIGFYNQSILLACDYSRPYLGIAVALTREANNSISADLETNDASQKQILDVLTEANNYFVWAQRATNRPSNSLFEERLRYGLAEWHVIRAILPDIDQQAELAEARKHYTALIDRYERGPAEIKQRVLLESMIASSYANRALTNTFLNPEQAAKDYARAAELEKDTGRRSQWLKSLSRIYKDQGDCINARQTLGQAMALADGEERAQQLREEFDELNNVCPTS